MEKRKGISLIVLVITIIVIIILAGAVILNVTKNNPMDSAKIAKVVQERETIEQSVQLYFNKILAATSGEYSISEVLRGIKVTEKNSEGTDVEKELCKPLIEGEAATLTSLDAESTPISSTAVFKINADNAKSELDISLPGQANADWYVDITSGKCYLVYSDVTKIPNWTGINSNVLTNQTLLSFVVKK